MIDVQAIAAKNIQITNEDIDIVWQQSTGYTTDAAGHRTPTYSTVTVRGNAQPLNSTDLRHIDGLNLQGIFRSVHIRANVQGIMRPDGKGGDTLQFPDVPGGPTRSWLVKQVMESWPTWGRVLCVLQVA